MNRLTLIGIGIGILLAALAGIVAPAVYTLVAPPPGSKPLPAPPAASPSW